ncbi:hypothetical protein IDH20_02565 [Pelagibacterales bacterium SAG-MED39]|nr:hypothetical protein [Pelagibacterales bacterium SAG-MED39]
MSLEIHKQIEQSSEKNINLFNAEVINFPKEKKIDIPKYLESNNSNVWKLYDKSNINEDRDQLKAVIGICLTFGSLFLMGLYSNLI